MSGLGMGWSGCRERPINLLFRASSFFFFFLFLFMGNQARILAQSSMVPVDAGVVLDLDSTEGRRSRTSISMAVDEFYAAHGNYTTRVALHFRDSRQDVIGAAAAALDLLKNVQVQAIIGPMTSSESEFVLSLGAKSQVPVLSFATSPSLSAAGDPYFVRTALNDSSQVGALAAIVQSFGWREVVPIYEDTDYGSGIIPSLADGLQAVDASIPYRSVISPSATGDQLDEELYRLMTLPTRVFVVHMSPALASRLFIRANQVGMMAERYVWITTDGISGALDLLDPTVIDSMQGVIGVRPYVPTRSKEITDFTARFKSRFRQENPGIEPMDPIVPQLWAYDTAWALALAAETVRPVTPRFRGVSDGGVNSADLTRIGVSQIGPTLLGSIRKTAFRGLSGEFRFVDGQLQSSVFEIVNVNGNGGRNIGFWTLDAGISRRLNPAVNKTGLKPIIWPGDSTTLPKGWQIPTNGKRLRIAVPVKHGFNQFVNVDRNPATNVKTITGYCIDVFDAVMQALPYSVLYDYFPYSDGSESYDSLVDQVYLKNFDAVVGDVTIIANRSLHVDFTLPYTESGVSMIVAVKEAKHKNAWIFLKPLTTDLWLGSLVSFFFTGFVVWVLEHRINNEFRGTPSQQIGTIFYFAFSTLVFSHKEKLESNLARFAVIIWVFVVLILTSSYTASLTSMLTVQQLEPAVADVSTLQKNGDYVGYQDGSFTRGLLMEMGFHPDKLINYSTTDQYAKALSRGSAQGGVAAIFDEIPSIKLFLLEHCSDYTVVGPTHKTGGFGFVFPRVSPLVPDVSRAVLNVTEGDTMTGIERKWFGDQTACPSQSNSLSSTRLDFRSFGGLFLITGVVSVLAISIYLLIFLYKDWDQLKEAGSESSFWRKVVALAKHYDRRDFTSPTFRKEHGVFSANNGGMSQNVQVGGAVVVPVCDGSQSPMSVSNHSETGFCPPGGGMCTEPDRCIRTPSADTSVEMSRSQ